MIVNLTTTQTTNSMAKETEEQKKGLKFSPNKVKEVIERETKKRTDARKGGVEALKQKNEHKIGTSNGYMKREIPEVSASHEKKVMKSIAKTGHYEMPEKRKKELSDAWEKVKPGTGFKK